MLGNEKVEYKIWLGLGDFQRKSVAWFFENIKNERIKNKIIKINDPLKTYRLHSQISPEVVNVVAVVIVVAVAVVVVVVEVLMVLVVTQWSYCDCVTVVRIVAVFENISEQSGNIKCILVDGVEWKSYFVDFMLYDFLSTLSTNIRLNFNIVL